MDAHVFIKRLWRSLKCECVYLNAFRDLKDAERQIRAWLSSYNDQRPPSKLDELTPSEVYAGLRPVTLAAS